MSISYVSQPEKFGLYMGPLTYAFLHTIAASDGHTEPHQLPPHLLLLMRIAHDYF